MDIIYRINFSTRVCYVGKLDDTKIIEAHANWYYPLKSKANQSSWETNWARDVEIHGFKNQTYVTSFSYWPVNEIKSRIIGKEITPAGFEALKQAWGKPDKETCEALCILLAKKDSIDIEQQIDFLKRDASVAEMVSKEEFDRRKSAQLENYKLIQGLWLNFKNRKKPMIEEVNENIARTIERARGTKEGAIRVTYSRELAEAITLKITPNTVKDLMDQLERRAKDNPVWRQYIDGIKERLTATAYNSSGNLRSITYGKLFKSLYDYVNENNAEQLEILDGKADSEKLSTMLKAWLSNHRLEDILPYEQNNNFATDPFHTEAKKRFTLYMQRKYFNRAAITGYQEWRENWLETRVSDHPLRPGALYPTFLKKQTPDQVINNQSLRDKIYSEVPDKEFFIKSNWDLIYPEQITYCLTQKEANFDLSDNIETYPGFIETMNLDGIQWY